MVSYSTAMNSCSKGGQWGLVFQLLKNMQQYSIKTEMSVYNAAMCACSRGGQWQRALELLELMSQHNMQPNMFSYNGAVEACSKGGQCERVLTLLKESHSMESHYSYKTKTHSNTHAKLN